jgi:hypothetical protein
MSSIKNALKDCKGTGDAKGCGCGEPAYKRTYGLCQNCIRIWAVTTEAGKAWLKKQTAYKMKSAKNEEKKKDREIKRELNTSGAMKLADTYFSRYIRLFHSLHGYCTCYTCGTDKPIKECDNGHYEKREHKATRYHENNCRPQCKTCNGDTKHNGKQAEFRVGLSAEIGEEEVVEIERLARTPIKANTSFYRDLADTYRVKTNELQKKLKVKYW